MKKGNMKESFSCSYGVPFPSCQYGPLMQYKGHCRSTSMIDLAPRKDYSTAVVLCK